MSDSTPAQTTLSNNPLQRQTHAMDRALRSSGTPLDIGILNDRLGYFVRRLQIWIFQDFIRTLREVDIRPAQFSVLVVIEANPGLSQSELAHLLGIERARLVRLLDRLDERGFIRRLPSRTDRRSHALVLTRGGQKRMKQVKALAAEHEAHLIQQVGSRKWAILIDVLKDFDPTSVPKKGVRSGR